MKDNPHPLHDALTDWSGVADDTDRAEDALALLDAADSALSGGDTARGDWIDYLEATGRSEFLAALPDHDTRLRWTDTALEAIRRSGYTLETMLDRRVAEIPDQLLFREYGSHGSGWTYERIQRRVRAFAAEFIDEGGETPRVALVVENSVDGACADLACLLHDVLVTPLNVHFDADTLAWVFDRLSITVAVADSEERLERLLEVRRHVKTPFLLYSIQDNRLTRRHDDIRLLQEAVARRTPSDVAEVLDERPRMTLDDVCTVMFTSGSTGRPKGVAFSQYNLVTKRFARHAALPEVGRSEVLFCYLPLFHTFGRYLEMLGMLYWRGTYVFAGNPSSETFFSGIREVQPTGLISIPLRWDQIRERTLARLDEATSRNERVTILRSVVGARLRWGLSAAGYLDPKAFRFFQQHGVELCSGFGMTEATGGITMSPPGDYQNDTVGIPLPGMKLRFTDEGEMLIAGAYVARYLAPEGEDLELESGIEIDGEQYLPTGDIFRELKRGHLSIVDRVKDIYKNNRGQTVAPRRVEQRFTGVPGIRRTFLVGDHRAYNVLLIVPDEDDPVLAQNRDEESRREYFHQIVTAANQDLAPYERVVNFAQLHRDFSADKGELTPKGSFKRKAIEANFAETIETLYQSSSVSLELPDGLKVRISRWVYRDLGILEDGIEVEGAELVDRERNLRLRVSRCAEEPLVRVGDLQYQLEGDVVDLASFVRQPRLWVGNPSLIAFGPCREGWDAPLGHVSPHVFLPREPDTDQKLTIVPSRLSSPHLAEVNRFVQLAFFGPDVKALEATRILGDELSATDDRTSHLIRGRMTTLARHPSEEVRALAYRVLLLDEPMPDYGVAFPAFILSGLSFLNEESIRAISATSFERRRLEALRQRLESYRRQLSWPADEKVRKQFEDILRLLARFVRVHPDYYRAVRAELASWILHREDPALGRAAADLLRDMVRWFEGRLDEMAARVPEELLEQMIVFDDDIGEEGRERLEHLLLHTTFLKQSVMLAFDEANFDLNQVPAEGIWVSRVQARGQFHLFRTSINTFTGKHFDLLVILRKDIHEEAVRDTNYWMVVIAAHPHGQRVMPRFGCARQELGAFSLEFVHELTVWDKIREFSSRQGRPEEEPELHRWRKLYVRALAAVFTAWDNSGRRILPGSISPNNVAVPELDFRENALILSLANWEPYDHTFNLFRPMLASFYRRIQAHYPHGAQLLDTEWIFDACLEALGQDEGLELLREFQADIEQATVHAFDSDFIASLARYIERAADRTYEPLPLRNAIDRYHTWARINTGASSDARADLIEGLLSLYHLERHGERARYTFYRDTYFSDAPADVLDAFDRLLTAMDLHPDEPSTRRVELSDLQASLTTREQRDVFSRMVFPQAHKAQTMEVLAVGERGHRQVVVKTHITDSSGARYDVREPIEPEEIGQLYRLFFQEQYSKVVSEQDRHLIITDVADRVVGGIAYKVLERDVVHLDGIVVTSPLQGRGIAGKLVEDFATRMASRGFKVLKTGFIVRGFFEKLGFRVDRRWGGLVRPLSEEEPGLTAVDLSTRPET